MQNRCGFHGFIRKAIKDEALRSIAKYKKSDNASYKKLLKLVEELYAHPRTGTGHPEALKGEGGNVFSREVNKKDRLVYEIYDEKCAFM